MSILLLCNDIGLLKQIQEVTQFEYLGLILDPKLTMRLVTVAAMRRASQGQALALAVSYSLRYDKNSS